MACLEFDHWQKVPNDGTWRWPNFSPQEMACRGTGKLKVDTDLMDRLEALRKAMGNKPLVVTSCYRSPEHNAKVKGAKNSLHLQGRAVDISMANHDPIIFEDVAREVGFTGFGFYPEKRNWFMHLDTGPVREWGTPFPLESKAFVAERPSNVLQTVEARKAGLLAGISAATLSAVEAGALEAIGHITPFADAVPYARYAMFALAALAGAAALWKALKA